MSDLSKAMGVGRKPKKPKKKVEVDAAVAQAMGSLGNAWLIDDHIHAPERVLSYRLMSLSPAGPWGDGYLPKIARDTPDDAELATTLMLFLDQPWRQDKIRTRALSELDLPLSTELPPPAVPASAEPDDSTRPRESSAGSPGEASAPARASGKGFGALRNLTGQRKLMREVHKVTDTWGHVLVNGRGAVGETTLHLLCLLSQVAPTYKRLIRALVPWLATQRTIDLDGAEVPALDASYLGQPYNGEVALHFAVIHQDLELVTLLVNHGASVHAHASGNFLYSNIKLYFGGTVLGFAACLDNKPIVEYLIEHGAKVDVRDLGPAASGKPLTIKGMVRNNSVLHCCVLHERGEMYKHLIQKHGASPWMVNGHGDTPLLLATLTRSRRMVQASICGRSNRCVLDPYPYPYPYPYPRVCAAWPPPASPPGGHRRHEKDALGLRSGQFVSVPSVRDRSGRYVGQEPATDGAAGD